MCKACNGRRQGLLRYERNTLLPRTCLAVSRSHVRCIEHLCTAHDPPAAAAQCLLAMIPAAGLPDALLVILV
jgi:hypothetical protein